MCVFVCLLSCLFVCVYSDACIRWHLNTSVTSFSCKEEEGGRKREGWRGKEEEEEEEEEDEEEKEGQKRKRK